MPAQSLGDHHAEIDMAVRTTTALAPLTVDALAGDVGSCIGHVQKYDRLLGDDRLLGRDAQRVARSTDLASALLAQRGWRAPLGPLPWTVAIDTPCSLPLDGPARGVARSLLERIPELRVIALAESDMCCGGPGAYAASQRWRSDAILARKFENVVRSGAEVLVTENISCLVQLRRGARLHAPQVRVLHLMEVLDAAIATARPPAA
jgi:glycolate oxidase iron-sulfur subunit